MEESSRKQEFHCLALDPFLLTNAFYCAINILNMLDAVVGQVLRKFLSELSEYKLLGLLKLHE
jgi:hypothetical protein